MCNSLRLIYREGDSSSTVTVDVPRVGDGFFGRGAYQKVYEYNYFENRLYRISIDFGLDLGGNHVWVVNFEVFQDGDLQTQSWSQLSEAMCPNLDGFTSQGSSIVGLNFVPLAVFEYVEPSHTNILASGISQVDHLAAFDAMVEQRFANINLQAVLIYMIDTVSASALPSLAAHFDVLGYKGYGLAETEQQKRDVIKRAIELHRFKGTPWSIKEALRAIGYYSAEIEERLIHTIYYDGTYNHNGSQVYGEGHWADFRVTIDIGNDMGVTAQSAADAYKLILEYKNARSRLRDVSYKSTLVEYVTDTTEELSVNIEIVQTDAVGYYYDNTYLYSGAITHGTITETFT